MQADLRLASFLPAELRCSGLDNAGTHWNCFATSQEGAIVITRERERESHEPGAENLAMDTWPWSNEEESPFKGLPPLPKVFREPPLPSFSLPAEGEQEAAQELEGSCPGLQDKIAWVHGEMLRLRLADQVLFRHLYTLALEIQDLKELQMEMESFSREEVLMDEQGHVRDTPNAAPNIHSETAFEMTI